MKNTRYEFEQLRIATTTAAERRECERCRPFVCIRCALFLALRQVGVAAAALGTAA